MAKHCEIDGGRRAAIDDLCGQARTRESNWRDAGHFADEEQPQEGSQPDTLFFVESWTMGLPAAIDSLRRRRQHAERVWQPREVKGNDILGNLMFMQDTEPDREHVSPMSVQSASRLLGISTHSTREQKRAAYRQMASRYHPDRFGARTEAERRTATSRMAAINEAYSVLCSDPCSKFA